MSNKARVCLILASVWCCAFRAFAADLESKVFNNLPTQEWALQFNTLFQDYSGKTSAVRAAIYELERQQKALEKTYDEAQKNYAQAFVHISRISASFDLKLNTPELLASRDKLFSAWIKNTHAVQNETVFLAVGNSFLDYKDKNNLRAQHRLIELLNNLKAIKTFVAYDADSQAALIIEKIIPKHARIGISGRVRPIETKRGSIYGIVNPFIRMDAILSFKHIVLTPDSILGAGLLVEQYNRPQSYRYYILGSPVMKNGLADWYKSLESAPKIHGFKNLGISYLDTNNFTSAKSSADLAGHLASEFSKNPPRAQSDLPHVKEFLQTLDLDDVNYLVADSNDYIAKIKSMDSTMFRTEWGGGAVIFGSGKGSGYFEPLVKECVKKVARLMPIVTGGEKGFMEIANRVAIEQNAYSVGIRLDNKSQDLNPEILSALIEAKGYEHRIPFLFHDRKLRFFMPGGMGTMKEFATILTKLASDKEDQTPLIFVGTDYYKGLKSWFTSLSLPPQFMSKIWFINSAEDLEPLLQKISDRI